MRNVSFRQRATTADKQFSKDCSKPKNVFTYFLCKRPGHVASRYPTNQQKSSEKPNIIPEVKVINTQNTSDVGKKFIRDIRVGSSNLSAQVDTGTTICTIKSTVVLREGFNVIAARFVLEGFGGNKVESPGIIVETVQVDKFKPRDFYLRIVPDTAQKYDVILGQTFTEAPEISYSRIGSELNIMDIDVSNLNEKAVSKALSLEQVELDPGTVHFVNVSINSNELQLPLVNLSDNRKII